MIEIAVAETIDFELIGQLWQELETRADASFFQSWAWVGCPAGERFPDPIVLTARDRGQLVALGLFNRRQKRFRGSSLWLSESGDTRYDDVFVDHNGLLIERGQPKPLLAACLEAARTISVNNRRSGRHRSIYLSGVPEEYLSSAQRSWQTRILASRPAPFVDFDVLRNTHQTFFASLSSNTRYQI